MMDATGYIKRLGEIHGSIADDVIAATGGVGLLRCTTCGTEQGLSSARIASYFRSGWPKHCTYTMRWVTERQLVEERAGIGGSQP
jgi:hypothetical protein